MTKHLTEEQKSVLELLPDTRKNISETLGISLRAVRYRMDAMEDKGYRFERNRDGTWDTIGRDQKEEPQRVKSYEKSQITKDINDVLTEMERDLKEIVNQTNPVVAQKGITNTKGKSTVVIPRTDDHFGAHIKARQREEEFDSDEAERRVRKVIDHVIHRSRERGDVENAILGMFGDHVDGETVYNAQLDDIDKILRDQIKQASKVYVEQIEKLSDEFDHVTVVTVPGNHGSLSKDSTSNADDIVFDQVETGISWLDLDNVTMKKSYNQNFVEFSIRNHNGYARHGQDALKHAATSSGQNRWMQWKEGSNFDVAYHGHHHQLRMEPVGRGNTVFQCGTITPPSLFADSVGSTGVPETFYHFATDEESVEEIQRIRF